MPVYKTRLTRSEELVFAATAEELRLLGVAIEIPEEWQRRTNFVDVSIGADSTIYELGRGKTLYALRVRLVSAIPNLVLGQFDIAPSWDCGVLCELDDNYRFAPGVDFDAKQVLNSRFYEGLRFRYNGDRVEGWLLGMGLSAVPAEYRLGFTAPVELLLFGPAEVLPCRTEVSMQVLRSAKSNKTSSQNRNASILVEPTPVAAGNNDSAGGSGLEDHSEAAEADPGTKLGVNR
jgi:hypothetical protein